MTYKGDFALIGEITISDLSDHNMNITNYSAGALDLIVTVMILVWITELDKLKISSSVENIYKIANDNFAIVVF